MIKGIYTARSGWPASEVYFHATTPDWWKADAMLTAVERVRGGVTTGVSILGATPARADDPVYADAHAEGVLAVGIRDVLGIGPPDPFLGHIPRPWRATDLRSGRPEIREFTYEHCMAVSEDVIRRWHNAGDGRLRACLAIPYLCGMNPRFMAGHHHYHYTADDCRLLAAKAEEAQGLASRLDVLLHTHGCRGTLEFVAQRLGRSFVERVVTPRVLFAHGHGFTLRDVEVMARTGAALAWVPFASWGTRFGPAPLLDLQRAGVRVCVATDGAAPFHVSDLFVDIHRALYLIWERYTDMTVLTEGQALRLVTIDAARCLGLDREIGSLEAGKRADFIILDTNAPHLVPTVAVPQLVAYFVRGSDVTTTVIDGKIIVDRGRVATVDEQEVLTRARMEAARSFERIDLTPYLAGGRDFWEGDSHWR
jgi:cytosine/adenosine deaminase-related metal-dependent hydrolase